MKNALLVVFASAALSFAGCKSGEKHEDAMDSTAVENQVNAAMDSVSPMPADTTHMMAPADTTTK